MSGSTSSRAVNAAAEKVRSPETVLGGNPELPVGRVSQGPADRRQGRLGALARTPPQATSRAPQGAGTSRHVATGSRPIARGFVHRTAGERRLARGSFGG